MLVTVAPPALLILSTSDGDPIVGVGLPVSLGGCEGCNSVLPPPPPPPPRCDVCSAAPAPTPAPPSGGGPKHTNRRPHFRSRRTIMAPVSCIVIALGLGVEAEVEVEEDC